MDASVRLRLLDKVVVGDPTHGQCWLWSGGTGTNGYGQIRVAGKKKLAHRVAYEEFIGPIPDGLVLDHVCTVTRCVRPAHLEPVTEAENLRRARLMNKMRASRNPREMSTSSGG